MIDWMKYRKIYLAISSSLIIISIFSLVSWGLRLGVDFKGGSLLEYRFSKNISTETLSKDLKDNGFDVSSIQNTSGNTYLLRLPSISSQEEAKIASILENVSGGKVEELQFQNVGPTIGPELVRKTIYGIAIAAGGILLWVAIQFKSFKFGLSAVLAMLHDTFNLLGMLALFGHLFGVELDFLLVTAILTTLSFSVHDTIIVYDRIRETQRKYGGEIYDLANNAATETMVRSLNNSFTIIFMLLALSLLGGSTIKWFSIALLLGTVFGTYSSPFVAVPILVTWDEVQKKLKFRKSN